MPQKCEPFGEQPGVKAMTKGGLKGITVAVVITVAAGALYAPDAHAVIPGLSALESGKVVPDRVLATMRGGFLDAGRLTYFGVGLYSLMVYKEEVISASLELGVNLTLDGSPEVQTQFRPIVSFFHTCPTCAEPSVNLALGLNEEEMGLLAGVGSQDLLSALAFGAETANEVSGPSIGGINSVRGVGQAIQVDGVGSNIAQDIELYIVSSEAEGSVLAPNGPVGLPQEANGTINIEFETGARVTAVVENGQFGIKIAMSGAGEISNMIQSGLLAQQARVLGDFTTIRNMMVINARRDILNPFANRSMTASAIGSLTGISR